MDILRLELTIRGFMVYSFEKEFDTALNDLVPLVQKVTGRDLERETHEQC